MTTSATPRTRLQNLGLPCGISVDGAHRGGGGNGLARRLAPSDSGHTATAIATYSRPQRRGLADLTALNLAHSRSTLSNLPSCLDDASKHCIRPHQAQGDLDTLAGVPASQFRNQPKRWDLLPHVPPWNVRAWAQSQADEQRVTPPPGSLAVCALMGQEHPDDVMEWLQYHSWAGVDKVFLRENAYTVAPDMRASLAPFVARGFLDLGTLPGRKKPNLEDWFRRCSKPDLGGAYEWVAFIDLDEYLVVLQECASPAAPFKKHCFR